MRLNIEFLQKLKNAFILSQQNIRNLCILFLTIVNIVRTGILDASETQNNGT